MGTETRVTDLIGKNDVKIVPWTCMAEWKEVYDQIYSPELKNKKIGLESLKVWKARCENLPKAVDCSLILLRVMIKDTELVNNKTNITFGDEEHDLSMMYCTAITRCLNHILSLDPKKSSLQSMFTLAKGLQIPQWIVQLRHDASHGENLPSISVLRDAAHYIFKWLHTNYWEQEETSTWDWQPFTNLNIKSEKLEELLDTWLTLNLFSRAKSKHFRGIKDESLRETLLITIRKYYKAPKNKIDPDEWKLNQILMHINKAILTSITDETHAKELLHVILERKAMFLTTDALKHYGGKFTSGHVLEYIPRLLLVQWKEIICLLHTTRLLPELLEKIVDFLIYENGDRIQCNLAALWIKEICSSLYKLKLTQNLLSEDGIHIKNKFKISKYTEIRSNLLFGKGLSADDKKRLEIDENAVLKVDKKYPSLVRSITLPTIIEVPDYQFFINLIKKVTFSQTPFLKLYFNSLLDMVSEYIGQDQKRKLIKLTNIYTGEKMSVTMNGDIHTVGEIITDIVEEEMMDTTHDLEDIQTEANSNQWTSFESLKGNWSGTAIGLLPWQEKIMPEDLILPYDDWVPVNIS